VAKRNPYNKLEEISLCDASLLPEAEELVGAARCVYRHGQLVPIDHRCVRHGKPGRHCRIEGIGRFQKGAAHQGLPKVTWREAPPEAEFRSGLESLIRRIID
jgi:hypothetical protein